jgi:tRNA(fMet)-specific endonuclease VapC
MSLRDCCQPRPSVFAADRRATVLSLDTLIAAHALSMRATLVTNNFSECERVPGLQLDNQVPSA